MGRRVAARLTVRLTALLAALAAVLAPAAPASAADPAPVFAVLVLTPADRGDPAVVRAEQALAIMGRTYGLRVDVVHDDARFTAAGLAAYQTVMWFGVRDDVLGPAAQDAFAAYVSNGGGFLAVSGATVNAEPEWPWFEEAVGVRVGALSPREEKHDVTVNTVDMTPEPSASGSASSGSTSGMNQNAARTFDLTDRWFEPDTDPATLPGYTTVATYLSNANQTTACLWRHVVGTGRVSVTPTGSGYDPWGEGDYTKLVRDELWWTSGSAAKVLVRTENAAPSWPYVLSFALWITAIVVGGVIAVSRANRAPAPAPSR